MNKQIVHRDFAIFLFVISIVLAVFVSFNVFDVDYSFSNLDGNVLGAPSCTAGPNFIKSQNQFQNFIFSIDMLTTHNHGGELAVILFQDTDNYYAVDFSSGKFSSTKISNLSLNFFCLSFASNPWYPKRYCSRC